jgi:hypothetical protein
VKCVQLIVMGKACTEGVRYLVKVEVCFKRVVVHNILMLTTYMNSVYRESKNEEIFPVAASTKCNIDEL